MDLDRVAKALLGKYKSQQKHYIKCNFCGKFISQQSIIDQKSRYKFIPDSICGPEESYWICEKCNK